MPYQNPQIETLKEMMRLEERRAGLQNEIDALVQRLAELRDQLFENRPRVSAASATPGAPERRKATTRNAAPRRERGALKEQVIAALNAAGGNGVRVQDLASAIGTNPANLYAWFHAARKRIPQIVKIDGGHYRLNGRVEMRPRRQSSAGTAQSRSANQRRVTTPGSRPGGLTSRILAELDSAGEEGCSISELSETIGTNYRNISVWFSTVGKKNPQVKKLSPAVYRLEVNS